MERLLPRLSLAIPCKAHQTQALVLQPKARGTHWMSCVRPVGEYTITAANTFSVFMRRSVERVCQCRGGPVLLGSRFQLVNEF